MAVFKKTKCFVAKPTASLVSLALATSLSQFKSTRNLNGKGQIATMIFASRLALKSGLPINIDVGVVTEGEGQVKGLGKGAVQAILLEHGVTRVLAEEGGRTSRGSLGNIKSFLAFLNELHEQGLADLPAIETWWIEQAQRFFEGKPFALRFEAGHSLRSVVRDLLTQARKRQDAAGGTMFVGAMLQHLIGAKLSLVLPKAEIAHHGFSVADAPAGRSGDFELGGVSVHVTTAPGEAVMRKCAANLAAGRFPIVITLQNMLPAADAFAEKEGIADRIDVLDAEQFLVANLHEWGQFQSNLRRVSVLSLIDAYNRIVGLTETDPSLLIASD